MKKICLIGLFIFCLFASSCIPPFLEGMVEMQDCFSSVTYQTYIIDYAEEQGYKLEEEQIIELYKFCDNDEKNIYYRAYKQFDFTVKRTQKIKSLAFIMQASEDCLVKLLVRNNEVEVKQLEINLKKEQKYTVEILNIDLQLEEGKSLIFSIENPLELIEISTRIDSFILIGE